MTQEEENGDWSNGMLALNPDYRGWLTVYGTGVDNPVVLGETNDTYLRHDFYGEWSVAGTLFLDEDTDLDQNGNIIIYGHKMKDKTMFGGLDKFKDPKFFEENGIVKWEDAKGTHYYEIFALMVLPGNVDAPGFIDLKQWSNEIPLYETKEMLTTIKKRAAIHRETWAAEDDTYMFLVTCDYTKKDGRLVLVARSV